MRTPAGIIPQSICHSQHTTGRQATAHLLRSQHFRLPCCVVCLQALSRWKKAQQAASTAAVLNARLQQLKNAPQSTASLQPCASIQEARSRGLEQLADYLVMEASQVPDQLEARNGRISASSSAAGSLPQQIPTGGTSLLPALTRVATLLEVGTLSPEDTNPGSAVAAKSAAAASGKDVTAAAAAAVSSRKLPSLPTQLELIMLRCSWKAVLCRSALMTDLVLTSLLGLALGIAQGRNIQPGSSLTWMLITLLAYGCISLVRSTRSYGNERHLYLQQESPVRGGGGGVLLLPCCWCVMLSST